MHNIYKSAIIFHPENQQELENILIKDNDAIIVAGCTSIMRTAPGKYPNKLNNSLIALDKYEKLSNFKKSSGFVEIGCAMSLLKLCDIISNYLSPVLLKAISETFSPSLQSRISIAGAIAASDVIYDLAAPLIVSGCILDVITQTSDEFVEQKLPIEDYYSWSKEKMRKTFIRSILLPVSDRTESFGGKSDIKYFDFYKTYSSSFYSPSDSIVMCASLNFGNDMIEEAQLAVAYADKGVHSMQMTNTALADNVVSYLNYNSIENMRKVFKDELDKFFNDQKRNPIACALFDKMIEDIQLDVL